MKQTKIFEVAGNACLIIFCVNVLLSSFLIIVGLFNFKEAWLLVVYGFAELIAGSIYILLPYAVFSLAQTSIDACDLLVDIKENIDGTSGLND